ncbi:MAG: hypothetical protein GX238_04915 [Epulopiscium sp.]|nr:hypothetical protein [Candidatus Epulonipiscium sp.]
MREKVEENTVLLWMILICCFILVLIIFAKPVKLLLKVVRNGLLGMAGIWILNFLFSSFQLQVGINWITGLVIGILGIPGVVLLYLLKIIL